MRYLTSGGFFEGALVLKKRGGDTTLVHGLMERDNAAATGLKLIPRDTHFNGYKLLQEFSGDRLAADAAYLARAMEMVGLSGRIGLYGLADAGAQTILIANRTVERASDLAAVIAARCPGCQIQAIGLDALPEHTADADLIVNCTALGMTPQVETSPWPKELGFRRNQVVYDLVYNPAVTRLLQLASVDGATVIGGLGMLIHQGAIAFERWTGETAPVDVMRRAVNVVFDR